MITRLMAVIMASGLITEFRRGECARAPVRDHVRAATTESPGPVWAGEKGQPLPGKRLRAGLAKAGGGDLVLCELTIGL